jgi:hypothetical protein
MHIKILQENIEGNGGTRTERKIDLFAAALGRRLGIVTVARALRLSAKGRDTTHEGDRGCQRQGAENLLESARGGERRVVVDGDQGFVVRGNV